MACREIPDFGSQTNTVSELGLYCPQDSQQNDAFPFTAGILICASSIHWDHISYTCSIYSDKSIPGSGWLGTVPWELLG